MDRDKENLTLQNFVFVIVVKQFPADYLNYGALTLIVSIVALNVDILPVALYQNDHGTLPLTWITTVTSGHFLVGLWARDFFLFAEDIIAAVVSNDCDIKYHLSIDKANLYVQYISILVN